jgi:CRP-like cAMP-binding protein
MKKTVPDYIIDGSIVVDALEAFGTIVKEFPGRPELLKMHAERLAAGRSKGLAIKQYDKAVQLFLDSGRLLQAWVTQSLKWQLQRPSADQLLEFHRAIESIPHNGAPADDFIQNLDPRERMAVFGHFRRICMPAGKTLLNAGKHPADLYFVVSGVLKETRYELVSQKPKFRREAGRDLWEADSFGEVYPFSEDIFDQPHVATSTRAELLVISRSCLIRACRRYPNVEKGLIRLCRIRSEKKAEMLSERVRKGLRYAIPTRLSVEVFPAGGSGPPIIMGGSCRDLSVSGVSFLAESNGARSAKGESTRTEDLLHRKVRVTIPVGDFSVAISGVIVRKRNVWVRGHKTQWLGIEFAKVPPRLRGTFFAFAENAKDYELPSR